MWHSLSVQGSTENTVSDTMLPLHRFNGSQRWPYLLPISLKDNISLVGISSLNNILERNFWHENWGPGHPSSLSALVPALRVSLSSEMKSLQWLQNPQKRKQKIERKERWSQVLPKASRVTRGQRARWGYGLSWMLIAPSVSVSEAPIDSIDCFFFFLSFFFFSSHLETSCFLNWMNFKVMVAHLRSENWGLPHSLPRSWVVWGSSWYFRIYILEQTCLVICLHCIWGEERSLIRQASIFQEPIIQALIIHFVKFLGLSLFPLPPPAGFWSFCCSLGLPPAGIEAQREQAKHY